MLVLQITNQTSPFKLYKNYIFLIFLQIPFDSVQARMVLKSLLFAFLLLCRIEAREFFDQDEDSSAGAGTYFYPRQDFSQYEEPAPISSEDGKVSKRKF